jgi:hypothetical protein
MPYLTMRELWLASDPDAGPADWGAQRLSPIVGLWWAVWLVRWVLGFVSGFTSRDPGQPMFQDTPTQMIHKVSWGVWADVALAAAAVLAFLVVREIDQRQHARRSRTQGGYGQTVAGV